MGTYHREGTGICKHPFENLLLTQKRLHEKIKPPDLVQPIPISVAVPGWLSWRFNATDSSSSCAEVPGLVLGMVAEDQQKRGGYDGERSIAATMSIWFVNVCDSLEIGFQPENHYDLNGLKQIGFRMFPVKIVP